MFVFSRRPGTVANDPAQRILALFSRRLWRPAPGSDRYRLRRCLCQLIGLAWIVTAIVYFPITEAIHRREARRTIQRLGGRYHLRRSALAEMLPYWLSESLGGEYLHPVCSINLCRSPVTDADVEALLHLRALEQINLCGCRAVSTKAIERLRRLPRMKLVWVDGMTVEEAGRRLTGEPIAASGR